MSSPTEAHEPLATPALVARLANQAERADAASALASHLGAASLLIFSRDPEVAALLPAPGFPQTLSNGRLWRSFLASCIDAGVHRAVLPIRDDTSVSRLLGIADGQDTVLVLVDGEPGPSHVQEVRTLLPLLTAIFRGERAALTASGQAAAAQDAARQARDLAVALDKARRQLQQAIRTRAEFLSSASHDLKNPLAAIKGTAQLLRRRAQRTENAEIERLIPGLVNIDVTATRMTALINDLLDLTQEQMDRPIVLERSATDLVVLVQQVIREYSQTSERHQLTADVGPREIAGSWDHRRLERALANLVRNAIKYSPNGGTVSVKLREQKLDGARWAVLTVTDQGLGIPAEDLPIVFERFRRGSNVVGRIGGTGIGLASVKQTVEAHGGTVTVDSRLGEGSRFILRLPIIPEGVESTGDSYSASNVLRGASHG